MNGLHRPTLLLAAALPVLTALPSPAAAQLRQPSPWGAETAPAPMLPVYLAEPDEQRTGLGGAVVGAAVGTFLALPLFFIEASRDASCRHGGTEIGCYTPMVPLALGAGIGASAGSAETGGQAAFRRTMLGGALGAAFGAAVILGDSAPVGGGSILVGIVAPGIGAVVGNRTGQPR